MSQSPVRPFPQVRFLGPDDPAAPDHSVWVYEGMLERLPAGGRRFRYYQRAAWPQPPAWDEVRDLGLWMVERLSINGHLLVGLRARAEAAPAESARLIAPPEAE